MRSTVMAIAGQLRVDTSLQHDEDAMNDADQFTCVGRIPDHADSLPGDFGDQCVDVALGADIDAARHVVEEEDRSASSAAISQAAPSAGVPPLRLRIASPGPRVLISAPLDRGVHQCRFSRAGRRCRDVVRRAPRIASVMLNADALVEEQPLGLPLLRHIGDAGLDRAPRRQCRKRSCRRSRASLR